MTCTATRHGTRLAYTKYNCRCPEAREATRIYRKRLRGGRQPAALVSAIGTSRRLQGLMALGHSQTDIARLLGVDPKRVNTWTTHEHGIVHRTTATRIDALFEQISAMRGSSRYALTVARRNGFVPPLSWDDIDDPNAEPSINEPDVDTADPVLVQRVLAGRAPYDALNEPERLDLWRAWLKNRVERFLDGPGVPEFMERFDVDKNEAVSLQYAVANNTPRRRNKTSTAAGSRTNNRKVA